jgi:hypothetical protein
MSQNILMHIVLMVLGVIVLLGAAFVGKTDKGGKKLSTHKLLGGIGILAVLAGGIGLIVTKAYIPTLLHFYVALLAIVFLLLTPIIGLLYLKAVPAKKAGLRRTHRFDAMVFFGLAALQIILGIISVIPMLR